MYKSRRRRSIVYLGSEEFDGESGKSRAFPDVARSACLGPSLDSRDSNCYANASMIIRGLRHPRDVGGTAPGSNIFQSQRNGNVGHALPRDRGPIFPLPHSSPSSELKKSISMKMRYKMGLNKHAPSLSSATCLHRVASTFRPRRPPFLLALPPSSTSSPFSVTHVGTPIRARTVWF